MRALALVFMVLFSGCATLDSPPTQEKEPEPELEIIDDHQFTVVGVSDWAMLSHDVEEDLELDLGRDGDWEYVLLSTQDGLFCQASGPVQANTTCKIRNSDGIIASAEVLGTGEAWLMQGPPDGYFTWSTSTWRFDPEANRTVWLADYSMGQTAEPETSADYTLNLSAVCDRIDVLEEMDGPAGLRTYEVSVESHNGRPMIQLFTDGQPVHDIVTDGTVELDDTLITILGDWGHEETLNATITLDLEAPEDAAMPTSPCGKPTRGSKQFISRLEMSTIGIQDDLHDTRKGVEILNIYTTV